MNDTVKSILLFKILISVARIDGEITPEAKKYLYRLAEKYDLLNNKEIKYLLYELIVISPAKYSSLIQVYLDSYSSDDDYFILLELIGGLIYCKDRISLSESNLLRQLQSIKPNSNFRVFFFQRILKIVQKLYRQAIKG